MGSSFLFWVIIGVAFHNIHRPLASFLGDFVICVAAAQFGFWTWELIIFDIVIISFARAFRPLPLPLPSPRVRVPDDVKSNYWPFQ